jgi:hypothetical protein
MTKEQQQSYKCLWLTVSTKDGPASNGEITVEARSLIDAIAVAKHKVAVETRLGLKEIVVYEVEEPFL